MGVLATGSAGAKVVGLLLTPVITRIYSPEDFGIFAMFVTVLALITPFVTLRYAITIPLPKKTGLAVNLLVLCFGITILVTLITSFLFWAFGGWVFTFFSVPELTPYWWLIPIAVLGIGLYETLSYWATRVKQFVILAKTKFTRSLAGNLVKIALGLFHLKPTGLLFGHIVSQAAGCASIFFRSKNVIIKNVRYVTQSRLLFLSRWYINFPKYQIGSRFLLAISAQAPLFFMITLFDAGATGQLSIALVVLAAPMALIGDSVGKAYFAEISEIGSKEPAKIENITIKVTKRLFALSLLPFLILLTASPFVFPIVFGQEWVQAGWFTSVLSFSLLSQFVSSPVVNTLSVFRKEDYYLIINVIRIVVICATFGASYLLSLSPLMTVFLYSLAMAMYRLFMYFLIMKIIREYAS